MFDEELFTKLLGDYFDESLTGANRERFEQMLCSSDRARRLFWETASQHALAREWALKTMGDETAAQLESAENVVEGSFIKRKVTAFVAVAAIVALSLFAWKWFLGAPAGNTFAKTQSEAPVAMVGMAYDAIWSTGGGSGRELRPSDLVLESGVVRIDFYSGARAWVKGPATFRLVSSMEMILTDGRVKVKVPPAARGFAVKTPELSAVDLGTEFGVMAQDGGRNEVHVFSGRVEVNIVDEDFIEPVLTSGEGRKLFEGRLVPIAADVSAFPDPDLISSQKEQERRRAYSRMIAARKALSSSADTLLHYDFSRAEGEGMISNDAAGADTETDGTIIGGNWVEGRWPGTKALKVNGMSDRVRLYLPGSFPQVTFMTWVKLDELPRHLAAIWRVENERPGCPHFNIDSKGRIRLGIYGNKAEFNHPNSDHLTAWDIAVSEPCLKGKEDTWVHLAAVYDSSDGAVKLYCDGQDVGTHVMKNAPPVVFGVSQIGSSLVGEDADYWTTSRETLSGSFGEFSISSRALSAAEIRKAWEAGKSLGR